MMVDCVSFWEKRGRGSRERRRADRGVFSRADERQRERDTNSYPCRFELRENVDRFDGEIERKGRG
jgi:hypothetical protein